MFKAIAFLMLLFAIPALGIRPYIVSVYGNATINDSAVPKTYSSLPGDRLKTETEAAIVLRGTGFSAQLGPESEATVTSTGISLARGEAAVRGKTVVVAGAVTISSNIESKFIVNRDGISISVEVLEGEVIVSGPTVKRVMKAQTSESFDGPRAKDASTKGVKKKTPQKTTQSPHPAKKSSTLTRRIPLIIFGGTGIGLTTSLGGGSDKDCATVASPAGC
jgi:hypothetical protein